MEPWNADMRPISVTRRGEWGWIGGRIGGDLDGGNGHKLHTSNIQSKTKAAIT